MTKHLSIVAAAALAVAGMGLNAHAQDTAAPAENQNAAERAVDRTGEALNNAADSTGEALRNAGDATRDALGVGENRTATAGPAANSEEIHDLLAQVTEAAMTKDGLDDMVERFVDADRNRLGQNDDVLDDNDAIDGRIAQIQQDWKAKYNTDFDINDEDKVFGGFAMISEGEIGDSARTAGERLSADGQRVGDTASGTANVGGVAGEATVNTETGRANVDVDNNTGIDAPRADTSGQTAADRNLNDPGRNIATVTIAASHGMPELKVPLIHEAGGWKIDIPDHVDATKLRDNVQNALTKCGENKDKWPADANEAYRGVTHKVLLAIFDKPLMDEAQKASDVQQPDQPAPAQPASPQ